MARDAEILRPPGARAVGDRRALPAWGVSLAAHAAIVTALSTLGPPIPPSTAVSVVFTAASASAFQAGATPAWAPPLPATEPAARQRPRRRTKPRQRAVAGPPAATATAAAGAAPSPLPAGPAPLGGDDRRRRLERYRIEALAPLVSRHTRYLPQAERLGLEGEFLVRITVDRGGKLVRAHLVGARPHALLGEAALAALRASAPLPPPPPELGATVEVDVPFVYRLST